MDCLILLQHRQWIVTTDRVMGGVSTCQIEPAPRGIQIKGMLSHQNNGGFVSARMMDGTLAVPTGAIGIKLTWSADQRDYLLIVHEEDRRPREYFSVSLRSSPQVVLWSDFQYQYRNQRDNSRYLDPGKVVSLGILLSRTSEGTVDFSLEQVEWMESECLP